MGIPITINEEVIGRACRRKAEGSFQWDLNSKTSVWKEIVCDTLFNGDPNGKYKDMQKEHKVLLELMQECFLPKAGGVDTLSLDHKVFLHYFIKFEKVILPKYIFKHMIWALRERQDKNRSDIPYIFYQGGILNILKTIGVVSDDQVGTMVGKYINAKTLKSMKMIKEVQKQETDLTESMILFDIMADFYHPVVIVTPKANEGGEWSPVHKARQ